MHEPDSCARWLWVLALLFPTAGLLGVFMTAHGGDRPRAGGFMRPAAMRQAGSVRLEGGVGWINSAPIRLEDLRGRIVLLDFWTFCCINCHHVLPALAKLEEKYKNELVVIGVHTPKFFAERETENLRRKVREYHIKHPVINDANQTLWERFGITSWPTLVILGPHGEELDRGAGEVAFETLDRVVGRLVREHKGDLNLTPVKFFPEIEKPDDTPLLFPGKVVADVPGKRLFIADTAHSRLVITNLNGKKAQAVGTGEEGFEDGAYDKAKFNRPQGMCLVEDTLYVADTENHALRAIDLKKKWVKTLAGTGKQTHRDNAHGTGLTTALTSPWDVVHIPGTPVLVIAMAGQHQLWRYNIEAETVGAWAGTGREDINDGPVRAAAFAQPSGLAIDVKAAEGPHLFVADSEGSSIRIINIKEGLVRTLAGTHDLPNTSSLFAFGDTDGVGDEVRLQHCLGLACGNGLLYIADTYNNKIKVCDVKTGDVKTLAGSKAPGASDDPPLFYQPGGLSLAGTTLYVADTNNHAIRTIDLKARTVKTLELEGLSPPSPLRRAPVFPNALITNVPKVEVAPGQEVTFDIELPLPASAKLNEDAPMPYLIETPGPRGVLSGAVSPAGARITPPSRKFSVTVPLAKTVKAGDSIEVKLSVSAFVCNQGSNLCQVKSYVWNVPITLVADQGNRVSLAAKAR